VQGHAIASNGHGHTFTSKVFSHGQHRMGRYNKVLDQRKRPIRGRWERNGRYYAQITVEDPNGGIKKVKRVPPAGAATSAQAVAKFQELLTQRRKGTLPILKRKPEFADYATQYSSKNTSFGGCPLMG
jgi:hypothetical protein